MADHTNTERIKAICMVMALDAIIQHRYWEEDENGNKVPSKKDEIILNNIMALEDQFINDIK